MIMSSGTGPASELPKREGRGGWKSRLPKEVAKDNDIPSKMESEMVIREET